MPRVKIDYVVSFSSESPDAPASNLLASEAGRGRWLCARGEPSCSVLLQLSKAVQISSITIGAHLAALVEVLVGRSETPNDQYKVLVASSVFLSPLESRKAVEGDTAADRVRTFSGDHLGEDVRNARWDRVRVQCSQPYNKHCKYGLSFIHIFSPEAGSEVPAHRPVPTKGALKMTFDLSPQDSDDDDLRPGALFAQHRASQSVQRTSTTDAQIRQATSDALKHQSDDSAKIVRTPISKPSTEKESRRDKEPSDKEARSDRDRDNLMYADDDDKPHDKIDRVVATHKDSQAKAAEKAQEEEKRRKDKERDKNRQSSKDKETDSTKRKEKSKDDTSHTPKDKHKTKNSDNSHKRDSADFRKKDSSDSHKRDANDSHRSDKDRKRDRSSSSKKEKDEDRHSKKQKVAKDDSGGALYPGPISDEPHTLLSDVHFVLSGYENPRRAKVRDAALAMGGTFHRDWGGHCTHLICAFPNTPKLKTVRSSPDGHKAIVVTAEWIERCAARQRRLPWQWFATEQKYKVQRARSASGEDPPSKDSAETSKNSASTSKDSAGTSKDSAGNSKDSAGTSKDSASTSKDSARNSKDTKSDDKEAEQVTKDESPNATVLLGSDCDTDDEIERVMKAQRAKKRQKRLSSEIEESPSKKQKAQEEDTVNCSRESDVAFVRDERFQGNVTVSDSDSDVTNPHEDTTEEAPDISTIEGLPSLFEGRTFAVHSCNKSILDERLLRRYVKAYGGEIVEPQQDEEIEVDYVLCLDGVGDAAMDTIKGQRVRGDWIWKCHERRKLCSPGEYAI